MSHSNKKCTSWSIRDRGRYNRLYLSHPLLTDLALRCQAQEEREIKTGSQMSHLKSHHVKCDVHCSLMVMSGSS